jgi:hypothetical protein
LLRHHLSSAIRLTPARFLSVQFPLVAFALGLIEVFVEAVEALIGVLELEVEALKVHHSLYHPSICKQ